MLDLLGYLVKGKSRLAHAFAGPAPPQGEGGAEAAMRSDLTVQILSGVMPSSSGLAVFLVQHIDAGHGLVDVGEDGGAPRLEILILLHRR